MSRCPGGWLSRGTFTLVCLIDSHHSDVKTCEPIFYDFSFSVGLGRVSPHFLEIEWSFSFLQWARFKQGTGLVDFLFWSYMFGSAYGIVVFLVPCFKDQISQSSFTKCLWQVSLLPFSRHGGLTMKHILVYLLCGWGTIKIYMDCD